MKKTYKRVIIFGTALMIIILNIDFIEGFVFLFNDAEVTRLIKKHDVLKNYQDVELLSVNLKSEVGYFAGQDFFSGKPLNETFWVRVFIIWFLPRDSVPSKDNWKVYGYVTMDKKVYCLFRIRGDTIPIDIRWNEYSIANAIG